MPCQVRRFLCALAMRSAKDKMEAGRRELAHGRTDYRLEVDAANAASSSEQSSRDGRFVKIIHLKEDFT